MMQGRSLRAVPPSLEWSYLHLTRMTLTPSYVKLLNCNSLSVMSGLQRPPDFLWHDSRATGIYSSLKYNPILLISHNLSITIDKYSKSMI